MSTTDHRTTAPGSGRASPRAPRTLSLPVCQHQPSPYTGPTRSEVLALRQQYLSPGLFLYYKEPLMIVEGHMQYVFDETGRRYLDAFGGIVTVSVGHCHPKVVEKVKAQTGKLQHTTTIYLHPTIAQFAEKLASHLPGGVDKTYFTNSGSEANELAILASREFTGGLHVVALRNGYHGGTGVPMGLTAHSTWKFKSNPETFTHHTHPGYCYRCPYGLTYPSCELKCAHDVRNVLQYETPGPGSIACFIGEPIQGVGGTIVPPPEFFQIVYGIVREFGGLCVADEVQGGFGRTGHHFWAHENWGVKPDIVTMAKGIGNGAPLAAMSARADVSKTLANKIHFNTYGGNPISMTQGLATLEVIEEEGIQHNALTVGAHLKARLHELEDKHTLIGEVRGLGLMLGVELVTDRQSREPAKSQCAELVELARERNLLLGKGGLHGNVIRLKPPMCITKDDADYIADCMDEVLTLIKQKQ